MNNGMAAGWMGTAPAAAATATARHRQRRQQEQQQHLPPVSQHPPPSDNTTAASGSPPSTSSMHHTSSTQHAQRRSGRAGSEAAASTSQPSPPPAPARRSARRIALAALLTAALVAELPSAVGAQAEHHAAKSKDDKNDTKADDDAAAAALLPLAPVAVPAFVQCETVTINATTSANPDLNAHNLVVAVDFPNGTEYFTDTVKGLGKKAAPEAFVWQWEAVDLAAGTQFLLSINQTANQAGRKSSSNSNSPRELILLPPTLYTVEPSAKNDTSCLQEASASNHKGRKNREAQQRGQNEVRIIGIVIGAFVFVLLLLIGFMALRRRREAKRTAANVDSYDHLHGIQLIDSSARSSSNHGQGDRAPGLGYMSRMVGGRLEPDGSAHQGPSFAPDDPFQNPGGTAGGRGHQSRHSLTTALDISPGRTLALGQAGSLPSSAGHHLAGPTTRSKAAGNGNGPTNGLLGHADENEPLPTYRESAADRRRPIKQGRLGADGRIQEGVVVRARPPRYQNEWRENLPGSAGAGVGAGADHHHAAGGGTPEAASATAPYESPASQYPSVSSPPLAGAGESGHDAGPFDDSHRSPILGAGADWARGGGGGHGGGGGGGGGTLSSYHNR